jgi:anti-sigma factor RsiW
MKRSVGHQAEELTALLDGELGEDEAAAVRSHLERCQRCAQELRSLGAVRDLIRQLPAIELPGGFYDQPLTRGAGVGAPVVTVGSARRRRLALAALSAAAALAVVATLPEERRGPVPPVPSLARGPAPSGSVPLESMSRLTPVVVPVGVPVSTAP